MNRNELSMAVRHNPEVKIETLTTAERALILQALAEFIKANESDARVRNAALRLHFTLTHANLHVS